MRLSTCMSRTATRRTVPDQARRGTVIGGKLYALPFDTDARALWYNKDLITAAGARAGIVRTITLNRSESGNIAAFLDGDWKTATGGQNARVINRVR